MKPQKLIISGWGPYKDKNSIDFTGFTGRNLFLVTGQTGAGKTTIFDAITYALYGTLSGEIREKGTVRSDFADSDTITFVELYMTHKDEEYHILRNPEYMRPKKRKNGVGELTKEKENATLTLPDGSIIAGAGDVTERMTEILRMDVYQFKQISMIAQGEFSRLIFASPVEKTAIFRELFDTGIYAALQAKLKEKAGDVYKEYMEYHSKMEENVHMLTLEDEAWQQVITQPTLDFEMAERVLKELEGQKEKVLQDLQTADERLEEEVLELQKKITLVRTQNECFAEYERTEQKIEKLKEKKGEITGMGERIAAAEKALSLSYEEKAIEAQQKEWAKILDRLAKTRQNQQQVEKTLQELKPLAEHQAQIERGYLLLQKVEETESESEALRGQKETAEEELCKLKKTYEEQQNQTDRLRREYEDADSRYRRAVVGVAARLVREGEPCPVCGAVEHPSVAVISEDIPDEEGLSRLKKTYDSSALQCNTLFRETLQKKNEVENRTAKLSEMSEQMANFHQQYDALTEIAREFLKKERYHNKDFFDRQIKQYGEAMGMSGEMERRIQEYAQEEKQAKDNLDQQKEAFEEAVLRGGFADIETYHHALLPGDEIEMLRSRIINHQKEEAAATQLCAHLKEQLQGKERVDEQPLQNSFIEKQEEKRNLDLTLRSRNNQLQQIHAGFVGIHEKRVRSDRLAKEYGIRKDLDDLASGNNSKRLVFEQYVLAGYFEQILFTANQRLKTMTDGRYELRRAAQMTDGRRKDNLEITVMDYYTGKERSVRTLSGGETFKASLSLALGLSDCIQARSGGILVETLFIDEGFGALDEESLDQACSTLQSLAEGNRMIGIISHVQELRERIENQIVVVKTNHGSRIR